MALVVEPTHLDFRRPFNKPVQVTLHLLNNNNSTVAFKVKTTAPKQYCVRPNSGFISCGQKQEVLVILQPMSEEPPLDARCRDKFMVQSVEVSEDERTYVVADLWPVVEGDKRPISEQKLRCNYLAAATGDAYPSTNGVIPPTYAGEGASNPAERTSDYPERLTIAPPRRPAPQSVPPSVPQSTSSVNTSNDWANVDLQGQISAMTRQLKQYESELVEARRAAAEAKSAQAVAEMALRQRHTDKGREYEKPTLGTAQVQQSMKDQKYSATLVATVALLSFLLGVIFF